MQPAFLVGLAMHAIESRTYFFCKLFIFAYNWNRLNIRSNKNFAALRPCLTAIWLTHNQLWAIIQGTAEDTNKNRILQFMAVSNNSEA